MKAGDQRMSFQRLLHDAALHAFSTSMNQAHLSKPGCVRFVDVLLYQRCNIARLERVQIELPFDWDPN